MKKVKGFKVLIVLLFILIVGVLPTVCVFIPFNEPYMVNDEIQAVFNESSQAEFDLKINVKNPTAVHVTKMRFVGSVVKIGWEERIGEYETLEEFEADWIVKDIDTYIEFSADLWLGQTKELSTYVNVGDPAIAQDIIDGKCEFVFWGGEFAYNFLSPFWFYFIGLFVFFLVSLFFTKQKFYFNVGTDKVEVYASMKETALIVNGQVIETKTSLPGKDGGEINYKLGEDEIKIKINRGGVMPNVKISLNGKEPTFTKVKINSFLKIADKKKGAF